ncbi:protein kinase [Nonomuraea sp. NPDC050404]|uniref:serine/threonine-protein kinase n=1 Tax=Nonomuraea sp. NPDC050404 TaxID=3155783 RepID=UPI0033FE5666
MLPVEDAPGYRVLDQAGQGGFAVVYRAYQERLDRVVALKVLSVDRVDQRTMRRFQRELQLTGRLTGHPNVVTVFDTGVTSSGKPYIAMDFFENGCLRDKVRKEGPLPVPDVLRAGVKLAGALAAVHEAGVLHGDIKPQNILISRYGELAIADFGVARVVDAAEVSLTSQAFTPLHAAPEVLTGRPHSASTDIYSLGSTLYHLLAGQPAFHNPSDPSIAPLMYRVLSVDPPPIDRQDLPPVLFETVARSMAKQPERRFGSARELARHLQAVQAELGLPVTDLVGQDPSPAPTTTGHQATPTTGHHAAPTTGHYGAPTTGQYGAPTVGHQAAPTTGHHAPPTSGHQAMPAAGHHAMPGNGQFPVTGQHLPRAQTGSPATQPPAPSPYAPAPYPGPEQQHPHQNQPTGDPARPSPTIPPAGSSRVKKGILVGGALAVVASIGTAVTVYVSLRSATTTQPPQTGTTAEPSGDQNNTSAPIDKQDVAALSPRQVKVTADQGQLVELRWSLPAASRTYPVVLQRSPAEGGNPTITALGQGTTTTRVAGLDPDSGYCFLVGVPLEISQKSTVAWSKPTCIRGAVAKPTP